MNMNWTTIDQSHVRERNSPQPSRSSWTKLDAAWRAAAGTRIRTTNAALTRNVAASKASAQPAPTPATTSPASPAPTIEVVLLASRSSAFACWRRAALTTLGTRPLEAGKKNAFAVPRTSWRTNSCQSSAWSREQQHGDRPLRREHDEVGAGHDEVARDRGRPRRRRRG